MLGGVTGAIAGGIIGHQNDETPEGAILGGVVGAVAGGLLGNSRDGRVRQQQRYESQLRYQQQQLAARAVGISDVINMARSGVSDAVIINHIQTHGVRHELQTNDIITLHQNGVREPVINAMQRMATGIPAVAARPPAYVPPTPVPTVVVERNYHVVPRYVPGPRIHVYAPPRRRAPYHRHHHYGWHAPRRYR